VFEKIRTYYEEVKAEMKKVTWPTFSQTKGSTWVVIATVILIAIYFGVLDFFLSQFIHIFLG
jgi:preprotein translocase subunit SecE